MNFSGIMQAVAGGLGSGAIYALLGISFTLIFGRLKICSIMHGDMALLGAFIGFACFTHLGIDPILSLVIIIPVFFVIGYLTQNFLLTQFMDLETWKGKYQGQIMVTFGIAMVIMAIEYFIFGGRFKLINVPYRNTTVSIGDVYIPVVTIISVLAAIAIVVILELILHKTSLGIQIRACSVDRTSSLLAGINYKKVCNITFGIATSVAGVAGIFYALRTQFSPAGGLELTFLGWVAVIMGGMGDLKGALIAGLLMGIIEAMTIYLWLPAYAQVMLYLVLLIFLIFRPNGMFQKYVTED